MEILSIPFLKGYWSPEEVRANLVVFMNLSGALILGLVVGYERYYHGRAAGMRTYGLVCMASAALVVISGYPTAWYGGHAALLPASDPTRVMQGIVTGIGFLGAGVIMKDGFNISGLTTAASIWASSAIGILVGVGFYSAAILLTVLSAGCMTWLARVENMLPARQAVAVTLSFCQHYEPRMEIVRQAALKLGYEIAPGSFSINYEDSCPEWRFVAVSLGKDKGAPLHQLGAELTQLEGMEKFHLSHARN